MKALSIRQPWAWLISHGYKNIENRDWPTRFRGPFLIHAGKTMTLDEYFACDLYLRGFHWGQSILARMPPPAELPRGGIVGQAMLLDCVTAHSSEWFEGRFGFVVEEAKPLPFLACKGSLGFFEPNLERFLKVV